MPSAVTCVWDLLWRANLGALDGEFGAFERLLWIDCSPTVDWLIDELNLTAEESLLDVGVGGPAAYGRAGGGRDAAARRTRGRGLPRGPDPVRLPLGAGGRIRAAAG
jgi:hypothetical protein